MAQLTNLRECELSKQYDQLQYDFVKVNESRRGFKILYEKAEDQVNSLSDQLVESEHAVNKLTKQNNSLKLQNEHLTKQNDSLKLQNSKLIEQINELLENERKQKIATIHH